jgi:transposase-like protein
MQELSYRRHRFHPDIIRQAVWLYFRFTMSFRDVEDLLAARGIDVSYETVRLWVLKFGPAYARRIFRRRGPAFGVWHLDEVFVNIDGRHCQVNVLAIIKHTEGCTKTLDFCNDLRPVSRRIQPRVC